MRNAYAVLLAPAILLSGPSSAQDRTAVRVQPSIIKPPTLTRRAPPPPSAAPAPAAPKPVILGPLWNPKAGTAPPQQKAQHELTHTQQQTPRPVRPSSPAPAPALTPLDRPQQSNPDVQRQVEQRAASTISNVEGTRRDANDASIDNVKK